jgi:hypothetical protein
LAAGGGLKLAGRPPDFQVEPPGLAYDAKGLDSFIKGGITH